MANPDIAVQVPNDDPSSRDPRLFGSGYQEFPAIREPRGLGGPQSTQPAVQATGWGRNDMYITFRCHNCQTVLYWDIKPFMDVPKANCVHATPCPYFRK